MKKHIWSVGYQSRIKRVCGLNCRFLFRFFCKHSTIDLIITKTPDIISKIEHCPPIGKSHHDTLTAILVPNLNPKNMQSTKSNNKGLKLEFCQA